MELSPSNARGFKVIGKLECEFTPEVSTTLSTKSGFIVELWQKSPVEVIFLGRGVTDDEGNFSISFNVEGKPSYLNNGTIVDVFMKVYYQGLLVSGSNPYLENTSSENDRPIKGLILREGLTDLGDLEIDITPLELPVIGDFKNNNPNNPSTNWNFLIGAKYTEGEYLPAGFRYNYQIRLNETSVVAHTGSVISSKEEFVKLPVPALSLLPKPAEGEFVIRVKLWGVPPDKTKQCYIEVTDGVDNYYTLITDLVVYDDFLCVFDGDSTYYKLADDIDLTTYGDALYVTSAGEIFGFQISSGEYSSHGKITFNQIEFPDELDEVSDGFYETNGSTGTVTSGGLGVDTFAGITSTVLNSEPYAVNLKLDIYKPNSETLVFTNTFVNKLPGSKNLIEVTVEGSPSAPTDNSPDLENIETVAGITFSTTLKTFLETEELTTLNSLKSAGPISYIDGFPTSGLEPGEVELLQGHVDLYTVNEDIEENQFLIDEGYDNLFDIANTPKSEFLNDVDEDLPLFKAVQIHEVVTQNQKLITNLLAARMSDYELADHVFPNLEISEFAQKEFASMVNKCECDDCKSGISPFAYYVDLIKYGARHIRKTGTGAYSPVNYASFLSLLEDYFIQPFGGLSVDCKTLHEQFCRVRLVTEVLETYVDQQSLPTPVLNKLADDRKKFLLLTYQTLLNEAGTSYQELRDIVKTQPLSDRRIKAEKWSEKLGIPLEVPGDTELTAERIWLTFDNSDPDYELDAENLEEIFGFRDTERYVLTTPPTSFMDTWMQVHLKDLWRKADYPFTSYSREYVDPTDSNTFKENWLPIIDPDIIGRSDLTYLSLDFAKDLLKHRKAETDSFLSYYITETSLVSRTSVDMDKRILRVKERDITSHEIEENEIRIEDSGNTFQPFNMLNRSLVGLDTDVILKKSTPEEPQDPIFQPEGDEPVMRYNRVLQVGQGDIDIDNSGPIVVTIDFVDQPLFQDVLSGGLLKLMSDASIEFYTNVSPATDYGITNINYDEPYKVSFEITQEDSAFFAGNLQVVYGVEVPLFTALIPSPTEICDELFTVDQTYNYLSPTPSGETSPFEYKVWDDPSSWPSGIGSGLSRYGKLKALFQIVLSGNATEEYQAIITNNLYLSTPSFIKMMEIFIMCENYLNSMFTVVEPTTNNLYELTSVFRISAKHELRGVWIKEEIKHDPAGGTDYIKLMLNGRYFWKALTEPQTGAWDPTLQTIPNDAININKSHIPIIDPELLKVEEMLTSPDAKPYRDLYFDRKDVLTERKDDYFSWLVPFNEDGFEEILNHINTGDENTPYTLPDYSSLEDLVEDFESTNQFLVHKAETNLWEAFGLSGEDFAVVLPIKQAYEAEDPVNVPSTNELKTAVKILTTGYKRIQLYGDDTAGWIEEEVTGSFPDGSPVKYYNVMKMRMPSLRGSFSLRAEWQGTLRDWNRTPTILPDIVPPENINEFVTGNTVHDIWVSRKYTLENLHDGITALFNSGITPDSVLLGNYEILLALVIVRADTVSDIQTYLAYFLNLNELENAGVDIRPYLEQYNITISAYRVLRSVYDIIKTAVDESQPVDLLESEYTEVVDILAAILTQILMPFGSIQEEFNEDIVLSGTDFQNYTPSLVNFPLTLIEEPNKWLSPNSLRKAWKEILETRIERSKNVKEQWSDVLLNTEDITMSVMRDALIEALRNSCETFEAAQERLAQMLFIETKDNCCVKHSRVSFAIETIQGFIFSLESGVYDDYLDGFSLSAPNFKKEWVWIGSYATWRSAVFTYIFPENLLYPTLKRLQSPPFLELSETIRNANRFSSDEACRAAKRYQDHFEDLQHLNILCTTNCQAFFFKEDPFDCCGDMDNSQRRYTTFYFAQSELSGKSYWSEKPFYYTDETQHSFWEELPLEKDVRILGVYALGKNYDENHQASDLALWLFYTYKSEGSMKMAYLKKDLMTAGSSWSEENEIDLPDLTDLVISESFQVSIQSITFNPVNTTKIVHPGDYLVKVTACQHSVEWAAPSFIFSYKSTGGTYRHIHVRYLFNEDTFDDKNLTTIIVFDVPNDLPNTAVLHEIAASPENKIGVTIGFNELMQTGFFGSLYDPSDVSMPVPSNVTVTSGSLFQKSNTSDHLIAVGRLNSGQVGVVEMAFSFDGTIQVTNSFPTTDNFVQQIRKVAPIFKQSQYPGAYAVEAYDNEAIVGSRLELDGTVLKSSHRFGLTIEKTSLVSIHSADCINDFDLRILDIRNHMRANLSAPQGNPIGDFIRTDKVKAYLYEAYYFVPMLIALDQQQRGHFEDALSWYRSVYDFANNVNTKRKIFYGLVLEQSITNVYQRPADWLLDPLNPHLIAQTRANAYTKYTVMNITQCLLAYADREFTMDTIETVPRARKLYSEVLSLLKIKELNPKASACSNIVYGCLQQDVVLPADGYWNNTFKKLQDELASYNDVSEIETASDAIKTIFEDEELNIEEKFSAAFDYVDSNFPAPADPESTTVLMNGLGERMNNAFRFLTAEMDLNSFNTSVATKVGITVGEISKIAPEDLANPEVVEKIEWLLTPQKSNDESFEFQFTNTSGVQKLDGEFAYDPMVTNRMAYQANLAYTNAVVLYERDVFSEPFTPLIDYRFCLPENPVYDALELKANLELYKIHNCRNIAGMVRELDIFAAPTDSTTGVPVIGASGNLTLPGVRNFTPSQYRFRVLIERSKQFVSMAQQLEGQFLATLEKEDAESYSLLKARQDLQTAKATVKLQDLRVKQANNERDLANLQLDKVEFSFDHFEGLISAGWNGYEIASLSFLTTASITQGIAAGLSFGASIVNSAIPTATKDFGASGTSLVASSLSTIASIMSQMASYARRAQEWEFQKELAGFDIQISKQQIKIAEDNIRIVGQERQISEMNAGHAEDTLEFLKTKFTNAELYRWMGNVLERSYSYMLSLATAVARTAERQYYFEQQEQSGPFILDDYWEVQETGIQIQGGGTDRRGMTGSVRLLQDITRLDQYAFEHTKRKLQLTRRISLAQLFPEEFQAFRETGVLNFELTNQFFDYDFPGQYLRLINGMKVSVIGLTPVNDGIKAMLTAGSTSYTIIEANNTFQRVPIRRLDNEEIALSSPLGSNGLFELQPVQNQELLNPFEGMGIESRWEFKMPRYSNRMDYNLIADVLVEVEYTALDNFQYRYQVLQEADNRYDFNRGFSFKNDFPDQWYELAEAQEGTAFFGVEFEISRLSFPQGLNNIQLDGSDLLLHFVREDGFTDELAIADFNLASAEPETEMSGETLNGTFRALELSNLLTNQGDGTPFVKLRLYFANTTMNREVFANEKVQDILLLMSCRAELPGYPL